MIVLLIMFSAFIGFWLLLFPAWKPFFVVLGIGLVLFIVEVIAYPYCIDELDKPMCYYENGLKPYSIKASDVSIQYRNDLYPGVYSIWDKKQTEFGHKFQWLFACEATPDYKILVLPTKSQIESYKPM